MTPSQPDPQAAVRLAASAQRSRHDAALLRVVDEQRIAHRLPTIQKSVEAAIPAEHRIAAALAAQMGKAPSVRKAQSADDKLPAGVIDLLNEISSAIDGQQALGPDTLALLNQLVAVMNAIDDVSTSVDEAAESPVDTGEGDDLAKAAGHDPVEMLKRQYRGRARR